MNRAQRMVLYVAMGVIALMLMFPPFYAVHRRLGRISMGYSILFSPPNGIGNVDVPLLLTQWAAVIIITVIAYFALRGDR